MVDLGTLGGTYSPAQGVNQTGQVVGCAYTTGNAAQLAFRWTSGGGMVSLGTLGGTHSYGSDVNDAGLAVGAVPDHRQHGFSCLCPRGGCRHGGSGHAGGHPQ